MPIIYSFHSMGMGELFDTEMAPKGYTERGKMLLNFREKKKNALKCVQQSRSK